jgi:hypothetical protein
VIRLIYRGKICRKILIYINDLPNCLDESVPSIFADDTNISGNATTVDRSSVKLNTEIQRIHNNIKRASIAYKTNSLQNK